jgi:hypothetical protein
LAAEVSVAGDTDIPPATEAKGDDRAHGLEPLEDWSSGDNGSGGAENEENEEK